VFWTKLEIWAGLPLLMALWPISSGSPARKFNDSEEIPKIKNLKNTLSVFVVFSGIAPAAHGVLAMRSGITSE